MVPRQPRSVVWTPAACYHMLNRGHARESRGAAAVEQSANGTPWGAQMLMSEQLRADVFISCGQKKDTKEIEIAHKIKNWFHKLGYNAWTAVEHKSPEALKVNIFKKLSFSDYFMFIDFKREKLEKIKRRSENEHRGSLFCNQELAIASYLDIPILAFQEIGVRPLDGLLGAIHVNAVPFKRECLLKIIKEELKRSDWDPTSKNKLSVTRVPSDIEQNQRRIRTEGVGLRETLCRWFLIDVKNNHKHKHAINCYAYLESARDLRKKRDVPFETAELKWQGHVPPNASIMRAPSHRRFAGFYVPADSPRQVRFDVLSDSPAFFPRLEGEGPFELIYLVLSENFPLARGRFTLTLDDDLDKISFAPAELEGKTPLP